VLIAQIQLASATQKNKSEVSGGSCSKSPNELGSLTLRGQDTCH